MKHTTLITAAVIIAAAMMSGCADREQNMDLTSVGGTAETDESDYNIDIRKDAENTGETPVSSDTAADVSTAEPEIIENPDDPKDESASLAEDASGSPEVQAVGEDKPAATTAKPAVTVTTDKPKVTTPAQTVRTDLPVVTAEPQYTTKATTTTKPAQTEPVEAETDSSGFPANPQVNQTFVDSTGQSYIYDSLFGWIKYGDGDGEMHEFPDVEITGNIILS